MENTNNAINVAAVANQAEKAAMTALAALGTKYLGRDSDGKLYGFSEKPVRQDGDWMGDHPVQLVGTLFDDSFSFVTSDAEEPVVVTDVTAPLLTRRETRYLGTLLRPFEQRVADVTKKKAGEGYERLVIRTDDMMEGPGEIAFPVFKAGKAYAGLEADHAYTLEELKLFQ